MNVLIDIVSYHLSCHVCLQITSKRRISPKSSTDQKPVTTSSSSGRSMPLNSAVRTTTRERPASPVATLSHDFQLLAATTEAQGQHGHQPLVLHAPSSDQKSIDTRRAPTDGQSPQSTAIQAGNT